MDNSVSFIGLLSTFDIIIAAIIVLLGIKGFMQGFFKEVFGIFGLLAGAYIAARTSTPVAAFIDSNIYHFENASLLTLIAFLSVFLLIWITSILVGIIFSRIIDVSGLGFLNRLFGFIAGGGKYFLVFAVITAAASNVTLVQNYLKKVTTDSILYAPLRDVGSYLINLDASTLGIDNIISTTPAKAIHNTSKVVHSQESKKAAPNNTHQKVVPSTTRTVVKQSIPVSTTTTTVQTTSTNAVTSRSAISH